MLSILLVTLSLGRAERDPEGAADPGAALGAPGVGHPPDGSRAVLTVIVAAGLQHYDELPDGAQTHVAHLRGGAVPIGGCLPGACFPHNFSDSILINCSFSAEHRLVIMHSIFSSWTSSCLASSMLTKGWCRTVISISRGCDASFCVNGMCVMCTQARCV